MLVEWATYEPILVFMGLFIIDLWANTCQTHHVTSRPWLMTFETWRMSLYFVLHLCTKFELNRSSRSEGIAHLLYEH